MAGVWTQHHKLQVPGQPRYVLCPQLVGLDGHLYSCEDTPGCADTKRGFLKQNIAMRLKKMDILSVEKRFAGKKIKWP